MQQTLMLISFRISITVFFFYQICQKRQQIISPNKILFFPPSSTFTFIPTRLSLPFLNSRKVTQTIFQIKILTLKLCSIFREMQNLEDFVYKIIRRFVDRKEVILFVIEHINNKIIVYLMNTQAHCDQEEGFAEEQPTQLVQYNYRPCYHDWNARKEGFAFQKRCPRLKLLTSEHLINDNIKNQWLTGLYDQISNSKHKNIVFNNEQKTGISFTEQNLRFDSEFQSGNLALINKIQQNEYDLYMKPDSNTKSHFQWFYFKVHIKKGQRTIKFTIRNFIKSTMLYSTGLKPYCRSLKNPEFHEFRQLKEGKIKFYEDSVQNYFNLEFVHHFEHDKDQVQFASQPPYTFAQLNNLLPSLRKCKRLVLGKTVLDQKIPYLLYEAKKQTKLVAVVIARQHPGQAVGSWMMEGFLNQIQEKYRNYSSNGDTSLNSLNFITWVVIPMINIDGVMLGNNRTGVLGHDFNRNWYPDQFLAKKNSKLFPETQGIITLMKSLRKNYPRKVRMFLDLHGHSSQPNVFTYGPPHQPKSQYFFQCRLFPELLAAKNENFSLSQCSYQIYPQKKQTARSVIFHNFAVPFTYTIESTFGIMNGRNCTSDDFLKIGSDTYDCASEFLLATIPTSNSMQIKQKCNNILQAIKIKYADSKNDGEQFESASEASDENPNRDKIEQLVINEKFVDEKSQHKSIKSKRYSSDKHRNTEMLGQKKGDLRNSSYISAKNSIGKSVPYRNLQKKRVSTQTDFVINRKQCIFPNISTKNTNLSFESPSQPNIETEKKNFKMQDLQKRLYRLRNSKIGKKILVINAYYS